MKNNNVNLGITMGILLGLFISMLWGYNLIWGKTFFGKEVLSQYATNQKIALYQTFQDIRDPVGAEHKNVSYFSKDFDAHMYIKRILLITDMCAENVFDYYIKEVSQKHEVDIDYSRRIIKFNKTLDNKHEFEGCIRIVQCTPVLVEITIRR